MEILAVPFTAIANGLESVWNSIVDLGQTLLDGISSFFVPHEGFFDETFGSIKSKFESKFGGDNQLATIFDTLFNNNYDSGVAPTFSIEIYGSTCNIIDFSMFLDYRVYIHGIIICIAYVLFAIKLSKRIPKLIGGI